MASTTHFVEREQGRVAYDVAGTKGPVVVAVPGMGDLRTQYRHLTPLLVDAGYRVVSIDVRGCGETSAAWDDYSAHAVANDVLAILEHMHIDKAVVLGNSFAAGSALWCAHDATQRIAGVVLLGPIVRDPPLSYLTRLALNIGFGGPWRTWFWTTYWDSLFPLKKPDDHAAQKAKLTANLYEEGRMDALKHMVFLSKADTAAMLPSVKVPSLVIMGTRDPDFAEPAKEAQWLTQTLSGQQLLCEGVGHYPHAEVPEQIVPTMLEFLARVTTRS